MTMRRMIGVALGATMLTGLGLGTANAGVIGPVSGEGIADGGVTITKAWYGGYGYWPRRHFWGPRFYWGPRRYAFWGYGRRCWWRPGYWGPVRVCHW